MFLIPSEYTGVCSRVTYQDNTLTYVVVRRRHNLFIFTFFFFTSTFIIRRELDACIHKFFTSTFIIRRELDACIHTFFTSTFIIRRELPTRTILVLFFVFKLTYRTIYVDIRRRATTMRAIYFLTFFFFTSIYINNSGNWMLVCILFFWIHTTHPVLSLCSYKKNILSVYLSIYLSFRI